MLGLIWAQAANGVIGRDGALPWHLPEDLAHFRAVTLGSTAVMGRRTWESVPQRFRPLPGRRNVVLTRRTGWAADGAEVAASLDDALALAVGDVWVIGGASVYAAAIERADVLEVTEVAGAVDGDTLAPVVAPPWAVVAADPPQGWRTSTSGAGYRFITHRR